MGLGKKTRVLSCLALGVCSFLAAGRFAWAGDPVNEAIDDGIGYLMEQVKAKQVPGGDWKAVGQVALETYALLVAGVPVYDPVIKKNFEYLNKAEIDAEVRATKDKKTYVVACYAFALDAAISQLETDLLLLESRKRRAMFVDDPRIGKEYRPYLEKAIQRLVSWQNKAGSWRYGPHGGKVDFDNSNVQFAVLALGVGAKRNVPIGPQVWRKLSDHFFRCQQAKGQEITGRLTMYTRDERAERKHQVKLISENGKKRRSQKERRNDRRKKGAAEAGVTEVVKAPDVNAENPEVGTENIKVYERGWSYQKGGSSWRMTCAGLSSLLLARDNLRESASPALRASLNKAIRDGYGWLMSHWNPNDSYYGVYSLEKVADIGGVKLFAGHDWYEEVSKYLVDNQLEDGSWPGGRSHGENPRVATAFALLVLNRATSLLTVDPIERIMVSGKASANDDPSDRTWVYVPELDSTMHYPTLLRTIRLRPTAKLIRFLRNIVDSYPEEWKGELVPEMAKVRDALPSKGARKVVEGYLADITGEEYDDWEKYLKWHRRWERVVAIGTLKKRERIDDLLSYYEHTSKSFVLKKTVIWALIQCKAKEALPLFLADLESKDARVRRAAYDALKAFFIDYPPRFDPTGSEKTRKSQVAKIKNWYGRQLVSSR